MYYNILDKKRIDILPLLKEFKKDFYLAGGTALALQLGHRDSLDFDFFCPEDINTKKLFEKIQTVFKWHAILKTQEEKNTLSVFIDNHIKLSFFTFDYKLVGKTLNDEYLRFASISDIACMKFSAITSRAANKDYIDLYFILRAIPLEDLLKKCSKKMPALDTGLILKSLVFFEDIEDEKIRFKNNNKIGFSKVKEFLIKEVKKTTLKQLKC
jgi:hypothetical protein